MSGQTTVAGVTTWKIDPTHTDVGFSVKHLMITTVRGQFSDVSGSIALDEENVGNSAVEVRIGAASISARRQI